jgi:hypothetical protein
MIKYETKYYKAKLSPDSEYATVGYMAKRIQMRKQRFLAIQKIAAEKKMAQDGPPGGDHGPKGGTMSRQGPPGRASVSILKNRSF